MAPVTESVINGVRPPRWRWLYRRARGLSWPKIVGPGEPPRCPPGWQVGPPDFVGVGAQRAGTSWWFSLILEHPRIDAPPGTPKELHFFDQFWWRCFDDAAIDEYRQYFPRGEGQLIGEWTPRYMHDAWVPALLRAAAPDAKILAILRDPVDRYVSGLAFDLHRGAPLHANVASEAFTRGLYARELTLLLKHVDRSQVLVLQYEQCVVDPASELARTFAFLGLDPVSLDGRRLERRINPSFSAKPTLAPRQVGALVEAYEDDVLALVRLFPEIDLTLWPSFAHMARERDPVRQGSSS